LELTTSQKEILSQIKLLAMDVDGTLTDGGMYYTLDGDSLKRFNAKDGMGITLLQKAGIKTAFVTHSVSPIIEVRAKKLQIDELIMSTNNKEENIKFISEKYSIPLKEIAYIGDDVNDLHAMKIVGLSFAPKDAVELVKQKVDIICHSDGGHGCIREVAELILKEQNKKNYVEENW
jgi:YrbI family 3-deoxy-D-manno-octulosonate 8-phosphate phosphatase